MENFEFLQDSTKLVLGREGEEFSVNSVVKWERRPNSTQAIGPHLYNDTTAFKFVFASMTTDAENSGLRSNVMFTIRRILDLKKYFKKKS